MPSRRVALAGSAVLISWWAWVVIRTLATTGYWQGTVYLILAPAAAAVGVVAGRAAQRRWPVAIPILVVGSVTWLLVGVVSTTEPGKPPLGYPNANAAFAIQLIALAGLSGWTGRMRASTDPRRIGPLLPSVIVVGAGVAIVMNRSVAGVALAAALIVVVAVISPRGPRLARAAIATATSLTGAGALLLLGVAHRSPIAAEASRAVDRVRLTLWEAAVQWWRQDPLAGGGPGSYVAHNPFGEDPDTAPAHSALLQVGAELGWIGVIGLALLYLMGIAVALEGPPGAASIAVASWSALAIQALGDHIASSVVVALTAGVVLGAAAAAPQPRTAPHRPG